jgi:hypothetical protein
LEYHPEGDRPVFRLGILSEDFSALNESQVGVEFLLKDRLVPYTVGPVQMVANREDDMAGLAIDTQNVNHVSLFDGHWPFYTHALRMPTVRLTACSRGEERKAVFFFSFETD